MRALERALDASRPAFDSLPDLVNVQEIAGFTGVSVQTVRREIHAGRLEGCRVGRRLLVSKPNLAAYVGMERGR